ncbi:MAG: histidine phosphatase family protein [Phycisphaerae bacterium]|nr:histidine phosphatase family protein [Saprospiraceae bacterium]
MKNLIPFFALMITLFLGFSACTTRYYIVRHAEKNEGVDAPAPNGPSLTAAGKLRALALRDSLKNKNVTRIFVSQYLRTQLTADASAGEFHITPTPYNRDAAIETLAAQLRAVDGNTLVVGHSDIVPALILALTGTSLGYDRIPDDDFDNFFIVKRYKGLGPVTYTLERRGTYGAISPNP